MVKKVITVKEAYYKGRRCSAEWRDEALDKFSKKYCTHAWHQQCALCVAWQNGFDCQQDWWRHDHLLNCTLGLADPGNHEDCNYDEYDDVNGPADMRRKRARLNLTESGIVPPDTSALQTRS